MEECILNYHGGSPHPADKRVLICRDFLIIFRDQGLFSDEDQRSLHELDMFIQQLHYEIAHANYGLWWPPNPLCGWSVVLPRGERKGATKISWDRCGLFLKLWLSLISHGPARSLALWQCCCMWAPKSLKVLCPSSNIMYINYSWIFLVLFWQKIEVFFLENGNNGRLPPFTRSHSHRRRSRQTEHHPISAFWGGSCQARNLGLLSLLASSPLGIALWKQEVTAWNLCLSAAISLAVAE